MDDPLHKLFHSRLFFLLSQTRNSNEFQRLTSISARDCWRAPGADEEAYGRPFIALLVVFWTAILLVQVFYVKVVSLETYAKFDRLEMKLKTSVTTIQPCWKWETLKEN